MSAMWYLQERAWLLPRLPNRKREMRTRWAVLGRLDKGIKAINHINPRLALDHFWLMRLQLIEQIYVDVRY